jgi:hypothetical protein
VRAYTYDVESVELTQDECVAFSQLVTESCHTAVQTGISQTLASVVRPWAETTIDAVQGQARWIWRTAVKL